MKIDPTTREMRDNGRRLLVVSTTGDASDPVIAKVLRNLGDSFVVDVVAPSRADDEVIRPSIADAAIVYTRETESCRSVLVRISRTLPGVPIVLIGPAKVHSIASLEANVHDALELDEIESVRISGVVLRAIDRHRALSAIRAREKWLHAILDDSSDGVLVVDPDGEILYANPEAARMFGRTAHELVGRNFGIPIIVARSTPIDIALGRSAELRAAVTTWKGKPAITAILRDVTEQQRLEQDMRRTNEELLRANQFLERLASIDPLTELLNRRGLEAVLIEELSRASRYGSPLFSILIDTDRFKEINDSFGHDIGDLVLKEIAMRIHRALRPVDRIGRVGGDEFLVLLPEVRAAAAMEIAERLRVAVAANPMDFAGIRIGSTISLAVIELRKGSVTIADLLNQSHEALMASKTAGRNRVAGGVGLEDERRRLIEDRRRTIQASLSKAISSVAVESLFELQRRQPMGVALRVAGGENGSGMPTELLKICEEDGCLAEVDLRCLEACVRAPLALNNGDWIHFGIYAHTLLKTPEDELLARIGLPPELRIRFEISDREFVRDMEALQKRMRSLRSCGIEFVLTHVGCARSSLESLILLEPEVIRLDSAFVRGCAEDASKRRFLTHMSRLGRSLQTTLMADGISNLNDFDQVLACGITHGQGPFLAQARTVDGALGIDSTNLV